MKLAAPPDLEKLCLFLGGLFSRWNRAGLLFALLPISLLLVWVILGNRAAYVTHVETIVLHLPRDWKQTGFNGRRDDQVFVPDWKQTGFEERRGEHVFVLETSSGARARVELEMVGRKSTFDAGDASSLVGPLRDLSDPGNIHQTRTRSGSLAYVVSPDAESKNRDIEARIGMVARSDDLWRGSFHGTSERWKEVRKILETSSLARIENPTYAEDFPEALETSYFYLILNGALYLVIFPIGCIACFFFRRAGWPRYWGRVGRFALVLGLLLVVGAGFSVLWTEFVYGRLYYSTDYVSDFFPYLPITQGILDSDFDGEVGGLLSASSVFELEVVWFIFAATTWIVTIWCYRRVMASTEGTVPAS
ncbi:MAG TPA: hypothetical protein VGH90_11010 [Chthoniobacteraceae bacterium]